MIKYDTIR